jgi:hypothetical protein
VRATVPDLPQPPAYYPVSWRSHEPGIYTLDAENARNLLKNRALDEARQSELRHILEGMK